MRLDYTVFFLLYNVFSTRNILQMGQPMNMRQGPPTGHMWKPENMGGAPNGMRAAAPYQPGMVPPFVPSNKQMTPQAPGGGGFAIAPAEDMIWHGT